MDNHLKRKYGLFTAICMVVGIVIGSGVFFKAQTILQKTGGDMPMGILAWVIGGAIMLVNLLTFSFMSQKYEKVSGLVDYAEATMGSRYGYLMGWFVATIYFPGMGAASVLGLCPLYHGVHHLRLSRLPHDYPGIPDGLSDRTGVRQPDAAVSMHDLCHQHPLAKDRR